MSTRVLVLVGTKRGAFLLESDHHREKWTVRGPVANAGWSFAHLAYDGTDGAMYAAGHNAWYGPAVWKSVDGGETWTLSSEGITYGDDGPSIRQIWHMAPANGAVYAGVDPAGLFRSDDGGLNWAEVGRIRHHPTASDWKGGSGGLCLHSIVIHPLRPDRMWVAMAGGGVLRSDDGGASWAPCNTTIGGRPGLRVQKLYLAADNHTLYQQSHQGVFRSDDGGDTWHNITASLPSEFGFALALHPSNPRTAYVMPEKNEGGRRYFPDGQIAVWRTQDGGASWTRLTQGLPEQLAYVNVLREGLATDSLNPAGVYFGTTSGHLFGSIDEGAAWSPLASHLPEIYSVSTAVIRR